MAVLIKHSEKNEYELFSEYVRTGSTELRDEIVEKYIYIAEILSRRFINKGVEYDDIYQVACMGVLFAVERFNPDRGVKFPTFATPTVLGEIRKYFRDKGSFVKIPRTLYEIFYKAERIRRANEAASSTEIARLLNLPEEVLDEAYKIGDSAFIKSLEDEAYADGYLNWGNIIGAEDDRFLMIENKDFFRYCMEHLEENEQEFIRMRYYENCSQSAVAKKLGISQMQVSRMERKILKKLKALYFIN